MRRAAAIIAVIAVASAARAQSPGISATVLAIDATESKAAEVLRPALMSGDPHVRAFAARVALVRGFATLAADLRTALTVETDATAAREEIRALTMLEEKPDLEFLIAQAKRFPAGIDASLAYAVARRGPERAYDLFQRREALRTRPDWESFFRTALWSSPARITGLAARVLGSGDETAWRALLEIARQSAVAVDAPVLFAALRSETESARVSTFWYLAHGYAPDPSKFPELLKPFVLADSSDTTSNRESFGRELVRRMNGGARREDPHWIEWLATREADEYLESDQDLLMLLSDSEFTVRENRCKDIPLQCALPKRDARRIPSRAVLQPDFRLPTLLPAGLAEAVVAASGCREGWLAVGSATVDSAGRVQKLDLKEVSGSPCIAAMERILRFSLADNERITSPLRSENLLFVRGTGAPVCLDEEAPGASPTRETPLQSGGDVRAPVVKRRVEPKFPESARRSMGAMRSVMVIVESTISKTGCVRNMRMLAQSPYPELNAAALTALSRWQFTPGLLNGEPVDVTFNLTVNFQLRH
jgi:TonB family protein